MTTSRPARRALSAAALAALLVPAAAALANMANPVHAGDRVGEPSAALRGISVVSERLHLDLRPLANVGHAVVTADYRLRNGGAARQVELLFVADALMADSTASVTIDGRPVAAVAVAADPARVDTTLPPSWRSPESTPLPGGGELYYQAHAGGWGPGTIRFRLPVGPGEHDVRVRYRAEATLHSSRRPTAFWQLGYVLAPARQWDGFGALDVRVDLPPGWEAASEPKMRREGDALVGRWSGVPADALALTTRMPTPDVGGARAKAAAAIGGAVALALVLAWLLGGFLGRRGRSHLLALPASLVLALAIAAVAGYALRWAPRALAVAAGPQRAWTYRGGGDGITFAELGLMLVVLGGALQLAARAAHRRARARAGR